MGVIRQLDSVTANGIAAGEVVERPASVVKELCENALDAGASIINIHTLNGGIKRIQITDNGVGMDREDALEAFERHATSKLRRIEDLDSLRSMGFRGEALAAISAVSRLTLTTRARGEAQGTKVYIEGGELLEHLPEACPEGSRFIVEDLFFNTPARFKFLKKDSTESAKITELVQGLALARPDVSFRLTHGRQEVLHSPGNGDLRSAVYACLGRDFAEQSIFIPETGAEQAEVLRLEGLIGLPLSAKKNRSHQLFYVNARLVKSPILTKALEEAYRGTLMHGQHPFAVLKLSLPPNLIDVNVHPQKLELRFWNEQSVFSAVYHLVKNALATRLRHPDEAALPMAVPAAADSAQALPFTFGGDAAAHGTAEARERSGAVPASGPEGAGEGAQEYPQYVPQALSGFGDEALFRWQARGGLRLGEDGGQAEQDAARPAVQAESGPAQEGARRTAPTDEPRCAPAPQSMLEALARARFVGCLFYTYLIFEEGADYYLIDQHAAHEKILYEAIVEEYGGGKGVAQGLLSPERVRLSPLEMAAVAENRAFIAELGFEVDDFAADEVLLRAVPASLSEANPAALLRAAVEELCAEGANLGLREDRARVQQAFATKACKAAVKANDRLSEVEVGALVEGLMRLKNPYQCPHGRPVIVKEGRSELEKRFKRII